MKMRIPSKEKVFVLDANGAYEVNTFTLERGDYTLVGKIKLEGLWGCVDKDVSWNPMCHDFYEALNFWNDKQIFNNLNDLLQTVFANPSKYEIYNYLTEVKPLLD